MDEETRKKLEEIKKFNKVDEKKEKIKFNDKNHWSYNNVFIILITVFLFPLFPLWIWLWVRKYKPNMAVNALLISCFVFFGLGAIYSTTPEYKEQAAQQEQAERLAEEERLAQQEQDKQERLAQQEQAERLAEEERLAQQEQERIETERLEQERIAQEQEQAKENSLTLSQKNARDAAKKYLNSSFSSGFSQKGLVEQLEFEGFNSSDANWAVYEAMANIDWNNQAALSAKKYMDYSSFSRQGLYDQLIFEGFTPEQANHGCASVGY